MTAIQKRGVSGFVQRVHRKYYGTEIYTAVVVTMILILQVYWMTRGHRE